jgi:hypothetical protein
VRRDALANMREYVGQQKRKYSLKEDDSLKCMVESGNPLRFRFNR